jgi:proteasome lid subunit RPN8/RPN11
VVACQQAAGCQEICGLCAVDAKGGQHFLGLTNCARDPDRFETMALDESIARSAARQREWEITAFVHTHLHGGPEMSERDERAFRRDVMPWIIVAISGQGTCQRAYPRPG